MKKRRPQRRHRPRMGRPHAKAILMRRYARHVDAILRFQREARLASIRLESEILHLAFGVGMARLKNEP